MADFFDFDELLSRYFEGAARGDDIRALEARLMADEKFADHVSRWCIMHGQIAELTTENALHELMDKFVQGTPGPPKGVFGPIPVAGSDGAIVSDRMGASQPGRRTAAFLALAAVIALIAVGAALWPVHRRPGDKTTRRSQQAAINASAINAPAINNGDTPRGDAIIATLTLLVDERWAPGVTPLHPGEQLAVGSRLALASGLAKVTFECGAEVVLEGPCDFVIQSQMLGRINSGKMTADVPRRAFGFAILSPRVDFVDLGTSFGVNIGGDGRAELHVFEGEVLCSQANSTAGAASEVFHVEANRAVQFAAAGRDPRDIAMDEKAFSQLIALRRPADVHAKRLVADRLALWLAADAAVATDDRGRVSAWQDIVYGDNRSAEDAVQASGDARPTLVPNVISGRPAVRFDGESDFLLTTPLETTDDQTVLIVGQFSPSAFSEGRRWGGQILNYDGPPSRYLSNLLEPGVLQIGEPLLESEFKPTLVSAQVFAGFIGSATVEVGRIDAEPVGADSPFLLSYAYDYNRRRAELRINGRSFGVERAFAPQGITSRKIIGRHAWMQNFFHGDLAELLIYNKALSADELAATSAILAEKYGIDLP